MEELVESSLGAVYTRAWVVEQLATNAMPTAVTQPAPDLTFRWLQARLVKYAEAILLEQNKQLLSCLP